MSFVRSRLKILCLLFSFFFVLYAISPLTYPLPEKITHEHCCSAQGAGSSLTTFRVFLVEVILDAVSTWEKNSHDQDNDTVLIRKKRALIPENAAAKMLSGEQAAVAHNDHPFSQLLKTEWPVTNIILGGTSKGFRSLYAGHSPPVS
jgi:hypothetical protein